MKNKPDGVCSKLNTALNVVLVIIISSVVGYGAWADLMVWIG